VGCVGFDGCEPLLGGDVPVPEGDPPEPDPEGEDPDGVVPDPLTGDETGELPGEYPDGFTQFGDWMGVHCRNALLLHTAPGLQHPDPSLH